MYVKVNDGKVEKYPYSAQQLRADNPNTSFPKDMNDDVLASWGVYRVAYTDEPQTTSAQVIEQQQPAFDADKDQWVQVWSVREKTAEEFEQHLASLKAEIISATQARLDEFAQARGYDSILSLCTYAADENPKFKEEGLLGVRMRSETWTKLAEILEQVQSGSRPIPSGFDEIESELPVLNWPQ